MNTIHLKSCENKKKSIYVIQNQAKHIEEIKLIIGLAVPLA